MTDKFERFVGALVKRVPGVPLAKELIDVFGDQDPERRHALDSARDRFVLEELPRLRSHLHTRLAEIDAARLNTEELLIVVEQTFEMQRRSVRREQCRRLTNVLVNGLRDPWDHVEHRLMLRYAFELEPEHSRRVDAVVVEALDRRAWSDEREDRSGFDVPGRRIEHVRS